MSEINFQPIFDYIDESHLQLKEEIKEDMRTEFRGEFDVIKTMLANISKQMHTFQQEMLVINHRHTSVEEWAKIAGDKIGVPFQP